MTLNTVTPSLKGTNFSKEDIEKSLVNNQLLRCSIEVSKACNLKCPFCYANAGVKQEGEITYEKILEVISQAKSIGVKTITLVGGEPIIYPRLRELVNFINDNGLNTLIFTNGITMTEELADFLFNRNVSLIVKFNSINNPEIQNKMVGNVSGVFEKIQNTIKILTNAGFNKTNPTRLGLETVISHTNLGEIPEIFRFARKNNIYPYIELIMPTGRGKEYEDVLSKEQPQKIFNELLAIDEKEFGYTWIPRPPQVASACKYYFTSIYINAFGKVQPCPGVAIELGDLNKETLPEIINKSETKRIRNIRGNIKGKCASCSQHDFCYGCRAAAYNVCGDIHSADPVCWVTS